mmetsp:Transcript_23869/g.66204  ORF Transcript_23869/g.66204 Transcript_23869/m.66204 type:complete len:459 (+) Transcript_23869:141-1517(+)
MGNNELRRQASERARRLPGSEGGSAVGSWSEGTFLPPSSPPVAPSTFTYWRRPSENHSRTTSHTGFDQENSVLSEPLLIDSVIDSTRAEPSVSLREEYDAFQRQQDLKQSVAVNCSLAANIILLVAKLYAFLASGSQAVLASMADSAVDLASQAVLALATFQMRKEDANFPIGKTRLETLAVIACGIIMGLASYEVLASAVMQLFNGFVHSVFPDLKFGWLMYVVLGATTALKVPLYFYCIVLKDVSASMGALAEDHRNDVLANLTALITAGIASSDKKMLWMVDPIGAVLISLYIIWSWALITKEQLDKLVGHTAPDEFLEEVAAMSSNHHEGMEVDVVRAYHFGERYTVEVEVILPGDMTVMQSHDIALDLQHKIEALEDVERAHVHVDYQTRDQPEHKVDRNLTEGWHLNQPHPDYLHITQGSGRDGGPPSPTKRQASTGSASGSGSQESGDERA